MKPFMGNPCSFPHCKSVECTNCKYYTPTMFDKKVPKWIGNIGFLIETWLLTINMKLGRN